MARGSRPVPGSGGPLGATFDESGQGLAAAVRLTVAGRAVLVLERTR